MFEMPFVSLKTKIIGKYGVKGAKILLEFRNKEILDTINSMSVEELETFYDVIEENLSKTKILVDWLLRNASLLKEERFAYDDFYHTCYKKIANLLSNNETQECRFVARSYLKMIDEIKASIKAPSDVREWFLATYKVKNSKYISFLKEFYPRKEYLGKYIEKYLQKLVKECGFEIEVVITEADILNLLRLALNRFDGKDVFSKLSFVNKDEKILNCLRNFEEFKEILINLIFTKDNIFVAFEDFDEEELEISLAVMEELTKTKSVNESNLLDTIFGEETFIKHLEYEKKHSME